MVNWYAIIAALLLLTIILHIPFPLQFSSAQLNRCVPTPTSNPNNKTGDAIPDDWKKNGIPYVNNHGIVSRYKLPGANPLHKDLYLEIDYMQFHRPIQQAIDDVVKAFANAPVCNPDGTTGINLHVQVDDQIPHQDIINIQCFPGGDWSGFDSLKTTFFGTKVERQDPNLIAAKSLVYHYGIFIHEYSSFPDSSGCSDPPRMNFVVSLGNPEWIHKDPAADHVIGTLAEQEGTLMHEFGHTLGLSHGGGDDINYKPNYLSVMNYLFQFPFLNSNRTLDYSRCALPSLNENSLDENRGVIGPSCPAGQKTVIRVPSPSGPVPLNTPYDFDITPGDPFKINVAQDIVGIGQKTLLTGYDDWNHITYIATTSTGGITASSAGVTTNNTKVPETIHPDRTVNDIRQDRLSLLNDINQAISRLPNSSVASPHSIPSITRGLGIQPLTQPSLSAKRVLGSFIAVGNDTAPFVNSTIAHGLSNSTRGIHAPISTISSNLQNDNLGTAIKQLDTLKTLVAGNEEGARSTTSGITPFTLVTNASAQKQIIDKINNLQKSLELQR